MTWASRSGIIIVIAVSLGLAARAEARSVRLADVLTATGRSPSRAAARARTTAAELAVEAAGAWPSTVIGAGTSYKTARGVFTAALPLPIFGTLGANRATARADLGVTSAEAAASIVDLSRRAQVAWLELARAEAHQAQAAAAADRETALADAAQKRFDAGDSPHAEVVASRAEAARARAELAAETLSSAAASASLAALLGWDPTEPLHADGGLPLGKVPALAALRARVTGHPEVRVADANIALENAHVAEAARARYPKLSLTVEADIDDPTLPGNDYKAGLTLELPLGGKTSAAERAAAARRTAAQRDRAARLRELEGGIVSAYLRWQGADQKARAFETEVLPAQRESAALARTAYQEGEGGLINVIQAERTLIDAEGQLIDARADAAAARADLEQAVGGTL